MARYFNFFPTTVYSSNNRTSGLDAVTNIIARFSFEQKLKENSSAFYKYDIQDSDTPEIIASKYYDSPERHWIVLLFNDIIDPQYDWPLDSRTIIEYIDSKYSAPEYADTANTSVSGLSWAKNINNVKSYYKTITTTNSDGTENFQKFEVDANTYANVGTTTTSFTLQNGSTIRQTISTETESHYEFEIEENEKKRTISLLKSEFIPAVEKEFKRVVRQ
jgi:hypothetical protein